MIYPQIKVLCFFWLFRNNRWDCRSMVGCMGKGWSSTMRWIYKCALCYLLDGGLVTCNLPAYQINLTCFCLEMDSCLNNRRDRQGIRKRVPDILKILDVKGLSWCQHCSMLDLLFLVQYSTTIVTHK